MIRSSRKKFIQKVHGAHRKILRLDSFMSMQKASIHFTIHIRILFLWELDMPLLIATGT